MKLNYFASSSLKINKSNHLSISQDGWNLWIKSNWKTLFKKADKPPDKRLTLKNKNPEYATACGVFFSYLCVSIFPEKCRQKIKL